MGGMGGSVCCGLVGRGGGWEGSTLIKVPGLPIIYCALLASGLQIMSHGQQDKGSGGSCLTMREQSRSGEEATYPGRPLRAGTHRENK